MASLITPSSVLPLGNKINNYDSKKTIFIPLLVSASASASSRQNPSVGRRDSKNYNKRSNGSCSVSPTSIESVVLAKEDIPENTDFGVVGMHHVGILCQNLETSLAFYHNILGLQINEARPHDKLPYRGAWLWVGSEMIHLMELPNPDPFTGRPEHGGRDRHTCIAIQDVSKLKQILDKAGIAYTLSRSGRPAIFTRDPDSNALEFTQVDG